MRQRVTHIGMAIRVAQSSARTTAPVNNAQAVFASVCRIMILTPQRDGMFHRAMLKTIVELIAFRLFQCGHFDLSEKSRCADRPRLIARRPLAGSMGKNRGWRIAGFVAHPLLDLNQLGCVGFVR